MNHLAMSIREVPSGDDFLEVKPGDLVVVEKDRCFPFGREDNDGDWWLGHVIHSVCGARNSNVNSLFQVADVDTGCIRTINADLVKGILRLKENQ